MQALSVRREPGFARRVAVVLAVLVGMPALAVVHSQPVHAQVALTCDPTSVFNLDIRGNIYSLNPSTLVNSSLGRFDNGQTNVNALGVTPGEVGTGAVLAYAAASAGGGTVFRSDGRSFTGLPSLPTTVTMVMGAVDPANGIYYYGGFQTIGSTRFLRILAFDPSRPAGSQGLGEVARVQEANTSTTAGDFAFDLEGNLFILVGRPGGVGAQAQSYIARVDAANLPTTPQASPPTLPTTAVGSSFATPVNSFWNGIAFGADANLYAQSTSGGVASLAVINPNSPGTVTTQPQVFPPGFPQGDPNDLAGCSTPGTLTVRKQLTRAAPGDQFTMTVSVGSTQLETDTTEGSVDGLQAEEAGPVPGRPNTVYTISEELSQQTSTSIDAYDAPTLVCVNTNTGTPVVPQATADPRTFTLTFPSPVGVDGANVVCTFTNTPAPPTLTLRKELGDGGRLFAADQFTVQIEQGGLPVGTGAATTQGTGAAVTPGTGTLTVSPATANATYTLSEVMAAGSTSILDGYQQIVYCVDLNHVQTGLPDQTFTASAQTVDVAPVPGSNIDCVITNAPRVPMLGLHKELDTDRVRDTDQFRVAIRELSASGTELAPTADHDPVTDGTGSTVLPDTGTTGFPEAAPGTEYFLTETAAGTPPTNLDLYTGTVTCKDYNSVQDPSTLPTDAPIGTGPSVVPVPGSWISCTITNRADPPTIELDKALQGPRVNSADQFTMRILADDQATVLDQATTSGTGPDVVGGTAVLSPAAAGQTYYLDEMPAGTTDLRQYSTVISCADANDVQEGLPTDLPLAGYLLVVPRMGAAISCTVTNTAMPPTLDLSKALGYDRVRPDDQFTVQILEGDVVVGDTTDATTQGSGDSVTPGTGFTFLAPATAGAVYALTEVPGTPTTDLAAYRATITCTDHAELQTGLPEGQVLGPVTVTPVAGALLSCTITNTALDLGEWDVGKTSDPQGDLVQPGDVITYTLTVHSSSPGPVTDAVVRDDLSDVLDDASLVAVPNGATLAGDTLLWQVPSLVPDETQTLVYQVRVDAVAFDAHLHNEAAPGPGGGCPDECETDHYTPSAPPGGWLASTGATLAVCLVLGLAAVSVGTGLVGVRRLRTVRRRVEG